MSTPNDNRRRQSLTPVKLAYDYMTRTGRLSHAELKRRGPGLAEAYEQLHPKVLTGWRALPGVPCVDGAPRMPATAFKRHFFNVFGVPPAPAGHKALLLQE